MNKKFAKIIALILCCILVVGVFAGCKKTNERMDALQNDINTNAAALAELKALVNSVKAAADAAATAEKLQEIADKLEANKADKTALEEAKTDIEGLKTTVDTLATSEALDTAITDALGQLRDEIAALADIYLTAEDITGKANTAYVDGEIAKLTATLQALAAKYSYEHIMSSPTTTANSKENNPIGKAIMDYLGRQGYVDQSTFSQWAEANFGPKASTEPDKEGKVTVWYYITEAINASKNEIQGQINNINNKLNTLQTKDNELTTLINGIKAQIEALNSTAGTFVEDFVFATKVLNGAEKVDGKDYSLPAFAGLLETFMANKKEYTDKQVQYVVALHEDLEFFLGRAVSAKAIVEYFDKFNTEVEKLPSLVEILTEEVGKYYATGEGEAVSTLASNNEDTDKAIAYIREVRKQISDNGADASVSADLQAAYDLLDAAYNYLTAVADSTEVDNAIKAIEDIGYVVFVKSDSAIAGAKAAIEAVTAKYFTAAAEGEPANEYDTYSVFFPTENATTVVTNSDDYDEAVDRQLVLIEKNETKITVSDIALNFATNKPLWTDLTALTANKGEFTDWCADVIDVEKDAESIEEMYGDEITLLYTAFAYATAMDAVYTETYFVKGTIQGVADLNAAVDALCAKDVVLFTDAAEFEAYSDAYEDTLVRAVKNAIKDIDNTIGTPDNYADGYIANIMAMIGAERSTKFNADLETVRALVKANEDLDAIYDAMEKLLADNAAAGIKSGVTFNDYDTIAGWYNSIKAIYTSVNIATNDKGEFVITDPNYVAFAAENDVNAKIDELYDLYHKLTYMVREIYDAVTLALENANDISLTFGDKIGEYTAEVAKIMAMEVSDVNLILTNKDDAEEVNLKTLLGNLSTAISNYNARAEAAQTEAAAITAKITADAFKNLNAATLNDYKAIKAVYDELIAWVTKYITPDVTDITNDAAVVTALNEILDVPVYGTKDDTYVFVIAADYTACVEKFDAAYAVYTAAEAAWKTLKAELEALSTDDKAKNIHNLIDYNTAADNYDAYVTANYGDAIVNEVFGETAIYATFTNFKTTCEAKNATADAKQQAILNAINTIHALTAINYDEVLSQIATIEALVAEYKNDYCPDLCEECIDPAKLLEVAQKKACAELAKYAAENQTYDDATNKEIAKLVAFYDGVIKVSTTTDGIDSTLATAKSHIDDEVAKLANLQ